MATVGARTAWAQGGAVAGHVVDSTGRPVTEAIVHLKTTTLGARVSSDGTYRIETIPAGTYTIEARAPGFASDSAPVSVAEGQTTPHDFRLRASVTQLAKVTVQASPRLNETIQAARARQETAPNIVNVLSGDEIRSLPALNAAEASQRIPGVTTERDEGEGKFVQIRGTAPNLQNVTIDGVHIPGSLTFDRSVKLDDIPADIIGAIEVSKTLTSDQDADAIGGSVNILSKVPEGTPRGYISGQFGATTLQRKAAGQGSLFYGGRFGEARKLGFLLGGSFDRNDRPIDDVEGAWAATSAAGAPKYFPNNISTRPYRYFRQRYGLDADLDYRINTQSSVFLRGLYSQFLNHGYRYVYDVNGNGDGAGSAPGTFIGTQGTADRQSSNRTPIEQVYAVSLGGKQDRLGPFAADYAVSVGGSGARSHDYRFSTFNYAGGPFTYGYDVSNVTVTKYTISDPAVAHALLAPANYGLAGWNTIDSKALGLDVAGSLNLLTNFTIGGQPAAFKFGTQYRNEQKSYTSLNSNYVANSVAPLTIDQVPGNFSDPGFYSNVFNFPVGPFPSNDRVVAYENSHPGAFTNVTDSVRNALGSYFGREGIYAAYGMQTIDLGRLHLNAGLRVEVTHASYTGHVDTTASLATLETLSGTHSYTDLFPSSQIKYEADDNTNLRLAITRGIARPNYADLAPSLSGENTATRRGLRAGNPNLKAQTAWNYDLLFERFLPAAGVVSGGVFYKDLHDLIYQRQFTYAGPFAPFVGYQGVQPQNGGSGHLWGAEGDYSQHLIFLPGAWAGLGFDANYTHIESQATLGARKSALPRTSPNLANASLLYDRGSVNARVAWVYQGAYIYSAGDGTGSPASGDTYAYAHSQFDASIQHTFASSSTTLQLQALNLNNAVFGFFQGVTARPYTIQREYYGTTFYIGVRQGF